MEIRSLAKSLALLEALAASPRPLSAAQLAQQLKLSRPTIYRILGTLAQHEYVTRVPGGPLYQLSFKLLDLGHQTLERTDLPEAARPVIQRLAERFGETVHLAVEEGGRMVYLDKVEGAGPFCTNSRTGRRVPMHCTALGKSVLAHLSEDQARAILRRHGMPRSTSHTMVTIPDMERELMCVRRQGYAIDDVEFEAGVRCVGAPVFDHRGSPIAAISVSAPVSRMPKAKSHQVGRVLRDAVVVVSRALGWRPGVRALPAGGVTGRFDGRHGGTRG